MLGGNGGTRGKGSREDVGISNFSVVKTERLLKTARILPAVNQVECHPYFQQRELVQYCRSKGIVVESYASLGRPTSPEKSIPIVLQDPVVAKIAIKHRGTPAQV